MGVDRSIGTIACPTCYICGSSGNVTYVDLHDRLFGAPGIWQMRRCTNARCQLLWLDPMPLESEIGKAYLRYYTHADHGNTVTQNSFRPTYLAAREVYLSRRYGYRSTSSAGSPLARLNSLRPYWRAEFDFDVLYLSALSGGKLLDVGCGWGQFLCQMTYRGWNVEGIDFDPKAIEHARSKGLTVHLGRLEDLAYQEASFDAVTMSHLIEHVHHPHKLLEASYRLLKPQGQLVIVTPNSLSWGHRLFQRDWMCLDPPRHLHVFNRSNLQALVHQTGFRPVHTTTTIRDANGAMVSSRLLQTTGQYTMGRHVDLSLHLWGRVMQMLEWSMLHVNRDVGEDLVLIATK